MPTYQYRCPEHTGEEAEKFLDITERYINPVNHPACPVCEQPMRRVFTPAAVHFKGGGWGGSSS